MIHEQLEHLSLCQFFSLLHELKTWTLPSFGLKDSAGDLKRWTTLCRDIIGFLDSSDGIFQSPRHQTRKVSLLLLLFVE